MLNNKASIQEWLKVDDRTKTWNHRPLLSQLLTTMLPVVLVRRKPSWFCGWRETILVNALAMGHQYGTSIVHLFLYCEGHASWFLKMYYNFGTNYLDPIVV